MSDSKALTPLRHTGLAFELLQTTPASSLDPCSSQQVPGLIQFILSLHGSTYHLTRKTQLSTPLPSPPHFLCISHQLCFEGLTLRSPIL